jgi:hypothetical protein
MPGAQPLQADLAVEFFDEILNPLRCPEIPSSREQMGRIETDAQSTVPPHRREHFTQFRERPPDLSARAHTVFQKDHGTLARREGGAKGSGNTSQRI